MEGGHKDQNALEKTNEGSNNFFECKTYWHHMGSS